MPLSKWLLKSDMASGQTVAVEYNPEDGIIFSVEETVPLEAEAAVVEA